jgi:site-specific DNA-methyltransferase (adenine-specific)
MKDNFTLHHGDCLEIMKDIGSVDAVITDPPYNIRKADWDKIDNYIDWCGLWLKETARITKDNGCLYFFHNDMTQIAPLMVYIDVATPYVFRQFIVWNKRFDNAKNKGFLDGFIEVEHLRNYQQMAEYILYYTFQDETGLSKIMGHCVYPTREYIRGEIIRARGKIVLKEINNVLGTADSGGGVASAVLSLDKANPVMITKEHYETLRTWLNNGEYEYLRQEYEDLRQEYEDLRQEYEDLRYTFNNQKTHHSVWNYEIAPKNGHMTPKPVELMRTIIRHSTNPGDTILDPFMGSGTTGAACAELGRNFIGIEIDKDYFEIAKKRIETAYAQEIMF